MVEIAEHVVSAGINFRYRLAGVSPAGYNRRSPMLPEVEALATDVIAQQW
jgi:hypothetical protein